MILELTKERSSFDKNIIFGCKGRTLFLLLNADFVQLRNEPFFKGITR
jgi:hypothetical protein